MDDHIEEIEDHPSRLHGSVPGPRGFPFFLPQAIDDLVGDGPQMWLAGAGGDDKIVGHARQFPHVEHHDVLRLPVVRQIPAEIS